MSTIPGTIPGTDADAVQVGRDFIGSILRAPSILPVVREIVGVEDMADPRNATIYSACLELGNELRADDLPQVFAFLREKHALDRAGGKAYIEQSWDDARHGVLGEHYAQIIRKAADQRRRIEAADRLRLALEADDEACIRTAMDALNEPRKTKSAALELGELIAMNPHLNEPVIDGFIRRGETATLIGASKSRKSWLVKHLAMAIAQGGMTWLGFEAKRGRVLLIDLELDPTVIAKRSRLVMESLGLNLADLGGRLKVLAMRGKAFDIAALEAMQAAGDLDGNSLIIIDPLYRCYPPDYDENSNADAAALYARFAQIAAKTGAALILVHHLAKGIHAGKATVDLGAGAGAMARAGDVHAAIIPNEADIDSAEFRCVLRSFKPVQPVPLRWSGFHWSPDAHAAEVSRRQWTPESFADAFTGEQGKGRETVLAEARGAGLTTREATDLLGRARDAGLIAVEKDPSDSRRTRLINVRALREVNVRAYPKTGEKT